MNYNTITPEDIDFDKYLEEDKEGANVIPAYAYADVLTDWFHGEHKQSGINLPWSKTHGKITLRPGEVSIWAGVNGHGKSLLLNQVVLECMRKGEACVIASMEMRPDITMRRMVRQAAGGPTPSEGFIRLFCNWTEDKLWLYTQQGTVHSQRMLAVLRYCDKGLMSSGKKVHVKHFIIDSLMKCGIATDDYNRQKAFIDELCAHARDTGTHIHLVAHARKGDTERKISDKFDIKGTSEITDQVDNVFTLWRNKRKEDEAQDPNPDKEIMSEPDAILICSKQRHGEWEGKIGLFFHKDSTQFVGTETGGPINFVGDPEDDWRREVG